MRLVGIIVAICALLAGLFAARGLVMRFFPIELVGVVDRIEEFHSGGFRSSSEGKRQLRQFAVLFKDGRMCEGYDTSFALVKPGDQIEMRGYHDVKGWPLFDPEWWECDEGQLVQIIEKAKK